METVFDPAYLIMILKFIIPVSAMKVYYQGTLIPPPPSKVKGEKGFFDPSRKFSLEVRIKQGQTDFLK